MTVEHWHGTVNGYTNHRCHCQPCKDAHSDEQAAQRVQRKARRAAGFTEFKHGASGYTEWGCRCQTCKAARAEAIRGKKVPETS